MQPFSFDTATTNQVSVTTTTVTRNGYPEKIYVLGLDDLPITHPPSRLSCRACTHRDNQVYCVTPTGAICLDKDLVGNPSLSPIWCTTDDIILESNLDCAFQTSRGGLLLSILLLNFVVGGAWIAMGRKYWAWLTDSYNQSVNPDASVLASASRPLTTPTPVITWSGPRTPVISSAPTKRQAGINATHIDASHTTTESANDRHDVEIGDELSNV